MASGVFFFHCIRLSLKKHTYAGACVCAENSKQKKDVIKKLVYKYNYKEKENYDFLFPLRGVRSLFCAEGGGPLDRLVDGHFKKAQVLGIQVSFLQTHTHALSHL